MDDVRNGRLERFSDLGLDYGGYYLLTLKETARRKSVRAFREWLLSATQELRAGGGSGPIENAVGEISSK